MPKFLVCLSAAVMIGNGHAHADLFKVTKKNFDKIQIGMTKDEVVRILGKKADSITETYTAGYGKSEMWQFRNWAGTKAITVFFHEDKVTAKNWIDL